tara:strand:+ start:120 stop:719 length:600 start_codon:yes stop_codon:yes gene_type:complete
MPPLFYYTQSEQDKIESSKNRPSDGIFLIDDFFSKENCIRIIKEIETDQLVDETELNESTNVNALGLPHYKMCDDVNIYVHKKIKQFTTFINNYLGLSIVGHSDLQYRKIYGKTKYHIDTTDCAVPIGDTEPRARIFSCIIALNDDYDGGELIFPVQNRKIKLKRGQIVAFPPYWTHPHYTNELENGTFRYTINNWLLE